MLFECLFGRSVSFHLALRMFSYFFAANLCSIHWNRNDYAVFGWFIDAFDGVNISIFSLNKTNEKKKPPLPLAVFKHMWETLSMEWSHYCERYFVRLNLTIQNRHLKRIVCENNANDLHWIALTLWISFMFLG